jgi:hypothetical protein
VGLEEEEPPSPGIQ